MEDSEGETGDRILRHEWKGREGLQYGTMVCHKLWYGTKFSWP